VRISQCWSVRQKLNRISSCGLVQLRRSVRALKVLVFIRLRNVSN